MYIIDKMIKDNYWHHLLIVSCECMAMLQSAFLGKAIVTHAHDDMKTDIQLIRYKIYQIPSNL